MLSHNPGCWLANINKCIAGNIVLILRLVLLLTEKGLYQNLTRSVFDITRLTFLEKCEASFLVYILA